MTNQVPKTDGRGFPSGAYLNQNHPMDRTQWLEDTFPEWGSFLNQEIENQGAGQPLVVRRPLLGFEDR